MKLDLSKVPLLDSANPNYRAMLDTYFPQATEPRDLRLFITDQNNKVRKENVERKEKKLKPLPPFSHGDMDKLAATVFWNRALRQDPTLGMNADLPPNATKAQVARRVIDAFKALHLSPEGKDVPDFFLPGMGMTMLMEGLALEKNASHSDTKGRYSGIFQMGPEAFYTAAGLTQKLVAAMAPNLPDGHPFKNKDLSGDALWANARAIHVQVAAAYAHMKPEIDRIAKLNPNLITENEKAALLPILNTIPGVAREVIKRLENGEKLENITLASLPHHDMMKNNPRVYTEGGRLKTNIRQVLDDIADNAGDDGKRFRRQAGLNPERDNTNQPAQAQRQNYGDLPQREPTRVTINIRPAQKEEPPSTPAAQKPKAAPVKLDDTSVIVNRKDQKALDMYIAAGMPKKFPIGPN